MEAAADLLHGAVLVLRAGPRAVPVAVARARGRPARLRDGVPDGVPARGGRWSTVWPPACPPSRRSCPRTSSCAMPRSGTRSRCSPRSSCGPSSATSTAAATTRSTSAWPRRCCAPRRGRSSGCTGCGCGSSSRSCASGSCSSSSSCPACWILPEWWGAHDPFRAGSRANAPNPGSAAFAAHPAWELFKRFAESTVAPVELGTLVAVGVAAVAWVRRREQGAILALAALGFSWFALVAVMTEAGFAGNQRYLMVTTAAVSVLGGVGAVRVLRGRRGARRALARKPAGGHARRGRGARRRARDRVADDRGQGEQHRPRAGRDRARGLPVARPEGADRRERRQGAAARLRRRLQRAVPDADGRLRARRPRDQRGLEGHPAARASRSGRGRCRTGRS